MAPATSAADEVDGGSPGAAVVDGGPPAAVTA
jgi:hypothetical protein